LCPRGLPAFLRFLKRPHVTDSVFSTATRHWYGSRPNCVIVPRVLSWASTRRGFSGDSSNDALCMEIVCGEDAGNAARPSRISSTVVWQRIRCRAPAAVPAGSRRWIVPRMLHTGHGPRCPDPPTLAGPCRQRDGAHRHRAVSASRPRNRAFRIPAGARNRNPDGVSGPAYAAAESALRCASAFARRTAGAALHRGGGDMVRSGHPVAWRRSANWRDTLHPGRLAQFRR
jgi:hypothetical protein